MERGYIQVYTGDGKGKTTAALGLALRAAGAGLKVYIVQFLKKGGYSELRALERFSGEIRIEQFGTGRYIRGNPEPDDIAAAKAALDAVKDALAKSAYDLLIMDEINVACFFGLVSPEDLMEIIDKKPLGVELVFTGRNAPEQLVQRADLVTCMTAVKHYYEKGVLARKGIEN